VVGLLTGRQATGKTAELQRVIDIRVDDLIAALRRSESKP